MSVQKCNERYTACWSSCDRYKEWRNDYDKLKSEADKNKALDAAIRNYEAERGHRLWKRFHKKGDK